MATPKPIDAYTALLEERDLLAGQIRKAEAEIQRLRSEIVVVERIMTRHRPTDTPRTLGPSDAVKHVLRLEPGILRADLMNKASAITSTSPEKAKKTIDQTIRNLTDKGEIVIADGRVTLGATLEDMLGTQTATP